MLSRFRSSRTTPAWLSAYAFSRPEFRPAVENAGSFKYVSALLYLDLYLQARSTRGVPLSHVVKFTVTALGS